MYLASYVLFGLATLAGDAPIDRAIEPAHFQEWFATAARGRLEVPNPVRDDARRFRYVFVGGFGNERMRGYFSQNARELRSLGVPRAAIHVIAPSSHRTIDGNSDFVAEQLLAVAEKGPEPLVLIGHSRGACDALYFALRHPRFVRDRVRALFLVQGPFGGTGLADYLTGDGPEFDDRMPLRHRIIAGLIGRYEKGMLSRGKHGGLPELGRDAARAFWDCALEDHAAAIPIVGPRTYYVTAKTKLSRLRLFQQATGSYLTTFFGPNDGMVGLDDQVLPGFGTVLAVLDAGHTDLTGGFPVTRAPRQSRRALIQGIVMALAEPLEEDTRTAATTRRSERRK
jgi:pimeloyl-ACP methyl ester carboxylesterase